MTRLNNLLNLVILAFLVSLLTPLAHGNQYVVQPGNSLSGIVGKVCNVTNKREMFTLAMENAKVNNIRNANLIFPGQTINVVCQEKKVAKVFVVPVAAPTKVEMAPAILPEPPAIEKVTGGSTQSDLIMYMANLKYAEVSDIYRNLYATQPQPEIVATLEAPKVIEKVALVPPPAEVIKKEVRGKKRYEVTRHLSDKVAADLYPEFRGIDTVAYFPAIFARGHDDKIDRWKHRNDATVAVARVGGGYELRIQTKELQKPQTSLFIDFKDRKLFEDFGSLLLEAQETWVERDYPQLPKKEYTRLHDAVPKRAGFLLRATKSSLRNVLPIAPSAALAVFSGGTSVLAPLGLNIVTSKFAQRQQTNQQASEIQVLRQEMGVLYEQINSLQQTLNNLQPAPQAQQK